MRHSRRAQFENALATPEGFANRWHDVTSDPNSPLVLVRRARVLKAAWRPPIANRGSFIEARCRGRDVLDIGCVAHSVERMSSPTWLHGRIAAVARRCIGVDVVATGIEEMRNQGYDVVLHDLTTGPGPIAELGLFDVIVAGEFIEHVESLDSLFKLACTALADDGQMILTTPNPYAPARVRAGQMGIVWENVDHVMYAFPSGIAELCERHGLRLSEAAVTTEVPLRGLAETLRRFVSTVRGTRWVSAGYATAGELRQARVGHGPVCRRPWVPFLRPRPFVGETFVYVVVKRAPLH